jgi:transposase InsO family protein
MKLDVARRWLAAEHGERVRIARALRRSPRTLRSWAATAFDRVAVKAGRPAHDAAARERVAALVERERLAQGASAGWRPIAAALPGEPVRLIQQELSRIKRTQRRLQSERLETNRVRHEVLARDAIWGEDATHLGHDGTAPVQGEVVRDLATTRTVALSAGRAATRADVIATLERARTCRGTLPLVWQTDNGSPYVSDCLARWLASNQVIHLRSRTHTPTDNPATERAIGELKAECGLDAGAAIAGPSPALERLEQARQRLDEHRRRASRCWCTAAELDAQMPRAEHLVSRARFYEDACAARAQAVLGIDDPREARRREREATWVVLERHGLVRVHRGRTARQEPLTADARTARMHP